MIDGRTVHSKVSFRALYSDLRLFGRCAEMTTEKKRCNSVEYLRSVPFLANIEDGATEHFANLSTVRVFSKGAVISSSEHSSGGIAIVIEGTAYATSYLADGRVFIIDVLSKGSLFGWNNLSETRAVAMEMVAKTRCTALLIDRRTLLEAMEVWPKFRQAMWTEALAKIANLKIKVVCGATPSLPARLASCLLRLLAQSEERDGETGDTVTISQHDLACMLPASREKVNRCLHNWEEKNLIELGMGAITVLRPDVLASFAFCDPVPRGADPATSPNHQSGSPPFECRNGSGGEAWTG
ncbi:hypothetical protein with possible cyclic nucleotide-binding domain [Aurantimonas manganoxydans SI85-9A1]|uniref:Uncharacterized protein n=2 Tax=Aurantimonas manganoxydans TaxID=651183 RepID=Q1YMU4_AURMS|nr:hypothetical protein with possible cyclic nucleotide-binding domain [Aurantimonas manganoxydans SI85-9A1]